MVYRGRVFSIRGGGRHKGVIDAVVPDMFDGSILYIVKTNSGIVVPVREDALDHRASRKITNKSMPKNGQTK